MVGECVVRGKGHIYLSLVGLERERSGLLDISMWMLSSKSSSRDFSKHQFPRTCHQRGVWSSLGGVDISLGGSGLFPLGENSSLGGLIFSLLWVVRGLIIRVVGESRHFS